jgi:hypothetical protein
MAIRQQTAKGEIPKKDGTVAILSAEISLAETRPKNIISHTFDFFLYFFFFWFPLYPFLIFAQQQLG